MVTGHQALFYNTTGSELTANGRFALGNNTTGANNTAIGSFALQANTTASNNTALGYQAGYSNTTGAYGTFVGYQAGYTGTTNRNTCVGNQAGYNSTGIQNNFFGDNAGSAITTGTYNSILGSYNGNQNGLDIRTASNYIVLSDGAGNPRAYWNGATMYQNGDINATGNVTAYYSSDAKFKQNIRQIDNAIEKAIVIGGKYFDWTDEYIANKGGADGYFVRKNDIGVVAQDVQTVLPEAVRTKEDGTLAVDYQKLVSLAFAAIAELKAEIDVLRANK